MKRVPHAAVGRHADYREREEEPGEPIAPHVILLDGFGPTMVREAHGVMTGTFGAAGGGELNRLHLLVIERGIAGMAARGLLLPLSMEGARELAGGLLQLAQIHEDNAQAQAAAALDAARRASGAQ